MTSENIRYHAAGHLAAAILIAPEHPEGARAILREMETFVNHDQVSAPPAIQELIGSAINNPAGHIKEMTMLEAWFVDPLNTRIEEAGGRFT